MRVSDPPPGAQAAGLPHGQSLRSRLWVLAAASITALLLVLLVGLYAVTSVLRQVEEENNQTRLERARLLLARRADNKLKEIEEFAFWDGTWNYIERPTGPAAEKFIRDNYIEWLPKQYGDGLIAIWARDRRPVLVWSDSALAGVERVFANDTFFRLLEREKSVAGVVHTPMGFMLVGGGVVHRSKESQSTGRWNGYLLLGQLINDSLLEQLGNQLQQTLALLPPDSAVADAEAVSRVFARGDSTEIRFTVADLAGRPAGVVALRASRAFYRHLITSTCVVLGLAVLVGLTLLALVWVAANRLLAHPLETIVGTLERMQQSGRLTPIEPPVPLREWSVFVNAFNDTVRALHASEEKYRTLFDRAVDALLLLDSATGQVVEANPAAEALIGLRRKQLLGRPLKEWLASEPAGPGLADSFRLERPDGEMRLVGVAQAEFEVGEHRWTLASLRDLTEREALELELRQAHKMEAIGSLAGGIAHDFNNLLGAVLIAISFLREEMGPTHPAQKSVETIEKASRRAVELTRQLLSFSRRGVHHSAAVSLNDVVANVERLCSRTFDRAIRLESKLDPKPPIVLGDAGELEQALLNLCINARDAMPQGGVLSIQTYRQMLDDTVGPNLAKLPSGEYVVLSVADTGSGMSPETQRRLFEPFFTTKEHGKGTGLGLAIVYGIVRSHHGAITARSEPDRGTRFDIYLPIARCGMAEFATIIGEMPRGTETVLIVDDETGLRQLLHRTLERLGYTVYEAENGREAIEVFRDRAEEIDLVILDIIMPEMDGLEAFHQLRNIRPDIRVLVSSGYAHEQELNTLMDAGADAFLPKPYDGYGLARAVREVLRRSGPPARV